MGTQGRFEARTQPSTSSYSSRCRISASSLVRARGPVSSPLSMGPSYPTENTPGCGGDIPAAPRRPFLGVPGQGCQGRTDTPFAYESTSTIVVGLALVAEPPTPSMTDCRPPDWLGVGQLPFTEQVLEMNRSPASVNLTPGLLGAW